MYGAYKEHLKKQLEDIKSSGLYKNERIIVTPKVEILGLVMVQR